MSEMTREEKINYIKTHPSICWDCSKATGGCAWSRNFKPVKGWNIIPTKKKLYRGGEYSSCIVVECPEFVRDATNYGLKRWSEEMDKE